MRASLASLSLLLLLAVRPLPALAQSFNLIINGSFEQGSKPGIDLPLVPGSRDIPGWQILGPVDYIGTFWVSSDGARSVDLDGTPGPGAIAQSFATQPGKNYEVAFDMAANTDGPPKIKRMNVIVAGTTREFDFDMTGHSKSAMGWQRKSFVFRAIAASSTIEFISLSRRGNWNGAGIDNVSVGATAKDATAPAPPEQLTTPLQQTPAPTAAPTAHFSRATDLSGIWIGDYPTKALRVRVEVSGSNTVATFIDSDGYVPAGKISWYGKNTGRTFFVRQVCAKRNYGDPLWKLGTVVVESPSAFTLFLTGCGNPKIAFRRAAR